MVDAVIVWLDTAVPAAVLAVVAFVAGSAQPDVVFEFEALNLRAMILPSRAFQMQQRQVVLNQDLD